MDIKTQKSVAFELQDKLKMLDGEVLIAGGAPSDWYRGELANDIDFYMKTPRGWFTTQGRTKRWVKEVLIPFTGLDIKEKEIPTDPNGKVDYEEYSRMHGVICVYEGVYKDVKFEIMMMDHNKFTSPENLVKQFDASICQFWVRPWEDEVEYTGDAEDSVQQKIIYISNDGRTAARSMKRQEKLINKYKDYLIIAEGKVIHNGLLGE